MIGTYPKWERDKLILQGIWAQGALQVVGWAVFKAEPQNRIPLVIGRTGCVDALIASSRVETHAVGPTAHTLLQTLIYILACFPIEHESITWWADTLVAPDGVFTLMLTSISVLTFIDINTGSSDSLGPIAPWACAPVAASRVLTHLVVSALMGPIFALIDVNTGPIFSLGHSVWTKINALIATTGVFTVLVWSARILSTFVHIDAFPAFELIASFAPTVETSYDIETPLVAGARFLTFIDILTAQPVRGSPEACSTVDHTAIGSDGVVTVLTSVAGMSTQSTLVDILTGSSICCYSEAFGAGAVIGSYGIVAGMGAGIPCCAFIFISTKGSD